MQPKSAKAKGRKCENLIKEKLRETGIDVTAYRVAGSGAGLDKGDVYSPRTGLTIEAKHTKNIGIASWRQALRQAKGDYTKPVLWWWAHGDDFNNSLVIIRSADLIDLLKIVYKHEHNHSK